MANFEVERLDEGLYCIHSSIVQKGDRTVSDPDGNIVVFAQDMLRLMDWCQHNAHQMACQCDLGYRRRRDHTGGPSEIVTQRCSLLRHSKQCVTSGRNMRLTA